MQALIWAGAAVTLCGIGGLVYCGRQSMRAKTLPEAEAKALMESVIRTNLLAMGIAILGLMCVVAGLILR